MRDIPADTILVRVHRSSCLGPDGEWRRNIAPAEKAGKADGRCVGSYQLTSACFTVLRLLHELSLGEASSFQAYLNVLPRDHRIPLEWSEAELELLEVRLVMLEYPRVDLFFFCGTGWYNGTKEG